MGEQVARCSPGGEALLRRLIEAERRIGELEGRAAAASGAEEVVGTLLREDAAYSLDAAVLGDAAGTDDNPPGLRFGVTPIAATAGGDLATMESDLGALAAAVAAAGGTSVAYVMNPAQASAVAIRKPDFRLSVWSSRALAPGTVIGLDATAFVSAFGTEPRISSSTQAVVHMEGESPLAIASGSPGSAVLSSPARALWQTRSIGLRLVAPVAFTMRGDGLVAVVEDATW